MPSLFQPISYLLPNFIAGNGLNNYSRRYPSCYFLRLPLLVYLDYVFPCLAVEDIICLRRVNKAFYLITHEPSIWRRFLERMNHHPVIYLRPTFDYSSRNTDYEIEQIVTRTISLDDNWRDAKSKVIARHLFETHYEVLDMTMVPGGKYLFASVKDRGSYRYYINLYILDHPNGPRAIARLPTLSKAFQLRAKYINLNGEHGIAISFVRQRFSNGAPVNISDYSHEHAIDYPAPYFSEVMVFFTPLPVLESLGDPNITWGSAEHRCRLEDQRRAPFEQLTDFEIADVEIQHLLLFENDGEVWVVVVTHNCNISFVHCGQPDRVVLQCAPVPGFSVSQVKAILPLPVQKQVLVVRQLLSVEHEEWVVELYPFPERDIRMDPTHRIIVREAPPNSLTKVTISDPPMPYQSEVFPPLQPNPLPPISIYFEQCQPYGLMHFCLWPLYEELPDGTKKCVPRYMIDPVLPAGGWTPQFEQELIEAPKYYATQTCHLSDPQVAHVLPGGYRAIYYTTSHDDRRGTPSVIRLRRYLSPEIQKVVYPPRPADNSLAFMRKKRPFHPDGLYGTIEIPLEDTGAFAKGINAITWDETIGRICIAVEGELGVRILDMARNVEPDRRFVRWMEKMSYEMVEQDCWTSKDCIHSGSIPGWYEQWLD